MVVLPSAGVRAKRAAQVRDEGARAAAHALVDPLMLEGVHEVLDRMANFAERVRTGGWVGHTGRRIRNIVNIGIGGSDLGPRMAYEALLPYADPDLDVRFVSNVDGNEFFELTRDLDRVRPRSVRAAAI